MNEGFLKDYQSFSRSIIRLVMGLALTGMLCGLFYRAGESEGFQNSSGCKPIAVPSPAQSKPDVIQEIPYGGAE